MVEAGATSGHCEGPHPETPRAASLWTSAAPLGKARKGGRVGVSGMVRRRRPRGGGYEQPTFPPPTLCPGAPQPHPGHVPLPPWPWVCSSGCPGDTSLRGGQAALLLPSHR